MNYIENQIEQSKLLVHMMQKDHAEREAQNIYLQATLDSLIKKLEERDEIIKDMRNVIKSMKQLLEK
jgi:hypothetical protein